MTQLKSNSGCGSIYHRKTTSETSDNQPSDPCELRSLNEDTLWLWGVGTWCTVCGHPSKCSLSWSHCEDQCLQHGLIINSSTNGCIWTKNTLQIFTLWNLLWAAHRKWRLTHEFKDQIDVFVIFSFENIVQLNDVCMVTKLLKKHNFSERSLEKKFTGTSLLLFKLHKTNQHRSQCFWCFPSCCNRFCRKLFRTFVFVPLSNVNKRGGEVTCQWVGQVLAWWELSETCVEALFITLVPINKGSKWTMQLPAHLSGFWRRQRSSSEQQLHLFVCR